MIPRLKEIINKEIQPALKDHFKFKNIKGSVVQTLANHIDVIIHNKNSNNLNLFVRRSFSNHLWSRLNDSARFI